MRQTDTAGFVTLQQIVADVKIDINDFTERSHKKLIRWAMRGLETFKMQHIHNLKTEKIWVTDNNTVPLPEDMLLFMGVGYVENGEYFGFIENENLFTKLETVEEDLRPSYHIGEEYNTTTGISDTYYKLDLNNGRVILSGETYDFVYLKYKSSGIDAPDNTFVPVHAQEALVAYVKYKLIADDDSVPEYRIERKRRDYEKKRREMKAYQTPTVEQIYGRLAKTWIQTPQ